MKRVRHPGRARTRVEVLGLLVGVLGLGFSASAFGEGHPPGSGQPARVSRIHLAIHSGLPTELSFRAGQVAAPAVEFGYSSGERYRTRVLAKKQAEAGLWRATFPVPTRDALQRLLIQTEPAGPARLLSEPVQQRFSQPPCTATPHKFDTRGVMIVADAHPSHCIPRGARRSGHSMPRVISTRSAPSC